VESEHRVGRACCHFSPQGAALGCQLPATSPHSSNSIACRLFRPTLILNACLESLINFNNLLPCKTQINRKKMVGDGLDSAADFPRKTVKHSLNTILRPILA